MVDFTNVQKEQIKFIEWLENKPGMINEKSQYRVTKEQALGLLSELYEVENEIKIHKWWDRTKVDSSKVLVELTDVLSHLANIANYLGVELIITEEICQVEDIEGQFLSLTRHMYELPYIQQKFYTKFKIKTIFYEFIQLIYSLGFSCRELEEEYYIKLDSNYSNPKFS